MWELWLKEFIIHGGFGAGLCLGIALLARRRKKARRLFRFGGRRPFSPGKGHIWLGWWLGTYFVWEIPSSFLMGHLTYRELALSAPQAVFFVFGLWLVDSIFMFIEPKSHWMKKVTEEITLPPAEPVDPADKSLIEDAHDALTGTLQGVKEAVDPRNVIQAVKEVAESAAHTVTGVVITAADKVSETVGDAVEEVKGVVEGRKGTTTASGDAEDISEDEQRAQNIKRLEDLTRGR